MPIFRKLFQEPVNKSAHYFLHCFTTCLYAFDPIQDLSCKKQKLSNASSTISTQLSTNSVSTNIYRKYFVLPVVIWLLLAADYLRFYFNIKTDYVLPYAENPAYFTHRMYAPAFWAQGDMLVLAVSSGIIMLGLSLTIRKRWLNSRYCMTILYGIDRHDKQLMVNGQVWFPKNGFQIIRFRTICRNFLGLLSVPSWAIGYLFFFYNFWNSLYTDLEHYFKMFVYLPIFTWYCIFTVATLFYHFFVVTKYITFKQVHLLKMQRKLVRKLRKLGFTSRTNRNSSQMKDLTALSYRYYWNFHSIQAHYAYQCAEIRALNQFWSLLLSILFSVEIITFCYLLYSCFFFEQSVDQFIYFFFYLFELGLFLFVVIFRASMVDMNNDYAYLENIKTVTLFGLNAKRCFTARQMINIEKMATNQNFSLACFRLVNGYRVDSTAFQMAFFVIGTFFLMICRKNRRDTEFMAQF